MTDQIDHELFYELQIAANRQTLWIHYSGDGSTVARFSPRGVDLHNTVSEQMAEPRNAVSARMEALQNSNGRCSVRRRRSGGASMSLMTQSTRASCCLAKEH